MKIGITIGDPTGIGPELVLRTVPKLKGLDKYLVFGNKKMLRRIAHDLKLLKGYSTIERCIVEAGKNLRFEYGKSTKSSARVALQSIQLALKSGVDIIITAPIVKATMRSIIPDFIGHTEYFADFFGIRDYAMTGLWRDKRIMLLTIHSPLKRIFRELNPRMMTRKIILFEHGLKRYFGVESPEIAIAAVNPHAFEFSLGEDEKIRGVVLALQKKGIRVCGPFPADTLFTRRFDGFVAVYHDQAMVFLKSKRNGLNFTLGLPIIRLSPLCGAALDIAGKGCAEIAGFRTAFRVGEQLYSKMRNHDKTVSVK